MIGKLTYEQVTEVAKQLEIYMNVIAELNKEKQSVDLQNFLSTVDRYAKFLETTVELYMDADKALSWLKNPNQPKIQEQKPVQPEQQQIEQNTQPVQTTVQQPVQQ